MEGARDATVGSHVKTCMSNCERGGGALPFI